MAYCSKCGKELKDNAVFCGNCGNQINKTTQSKKTFELFKGNFDFKSVLIRLKNYFAHFYVDYNSKAFKFAMALLLGFGVGEFVFSLFEWACAVLRRVLCKPVGHYSQNKVILPCKREKAGYL